MISCERGRWITVSASAHNEAYPGFVPELAGHTARCEIYCGASGQRLRLRLSERLGSRAVKYGRATFGVGGRTADALFGGSGGVTVPAGGEVCSDAVELPVRAGQTVSLWLYTTGEHGSATAGRMEATHSPAGDFCGRGFAPVPFRAQDGSISEPMCAFAALDAESGEKSARAIAAFGDSITAMDLWTAPLRSALEAAAPETVLLNLGIGGNRLLRDTNFPPRPGVQFFGRSGLSRYEWDCAPLSGVGAVIVALGINDIFGPGDDPVWNPPMSELPSLGELEEGFLRLRSRCRDEGRGCAVCTVTPAGGCWTHSPVTEALRQGLNAWLRDCGLFDMVIDFDAILRDESGERMRPEYDSGDHIHPNKAGGERMAAAIDTTGLLRLCGGSR